MKIIYMAHPVAGDVENNLERARQWLKWAIENNEGVAVMANWIIECELWDDSDPEQREAGLKRCEALVERCDELWLVGPRISSGMARERKLAEEKGLRIRDFTPLQRVLPPGVK